MEREEALSSGETSGCGHLWDTGVELPPPQHAGKGAGSWRVQSLGTAEETLGPQLCALGLRPVLSTRVLGTSLTICPREGGGLMTCPPLGPVSA